MPLDAAGLRAHLLDWDVPNRAGFEHVVELLHGANVGGQGLVFLREERGNALAEIRALAEGSVPAPVLWEFLGLLKKYPDRQWFASKQTVFTKLPVEELRLNGILPFLGMLLIYTVSLSVVFRLNPRKKDEITVHKCVTQNKSFDRNVILQ